MTVSYTYEVATCKGFGCFNKLLLRWKASIYKILWPEACLFFSLYFGISFMYRYLLNEGQKVTFERLVMHTNEYRDQIPISFVIGFYVSMVVTRWWNTICLIPWPDTIASLLAAYLSGDESHGRMIRRTIMRYINLGMVLKFRITSPIVKMRFPSYKHLIRAGILEENELELLEKANLKNVPLFFIPIVWSLFKIKEARKEGRITSDIICEHIIQEVLNFRGALGTLLNYDYVSIPLVYTQVVTFAVYSYFLISLISQQYLDPDKDYKGHFVDLYIPIFTSLQLFFYIGWLKVAETMINPFGDDDDDFEANSIIDRNFTVSFYIVDRVRAQFPPINRDPFWKEVSEEVKIPYTEGSKPDHPSNPQGSTAQMKMSLEQDEEPKGLKGKSKSQLLNKSHHDTREQGDNPDKDKKAKEKNTT